MADKANARADLVQVKIGATDYFEAGVKLSLPGERIPIKPARFGEEVGGLQGARNIEIEVSLLEASPAVMRTLLGFDGAGVDDAPDVGSAKPTVRIEIKDPLDGADLGRLTFYTCELVDYSRDIDGDGLATPVLKYRALRGTDGKAWSVGAAA